MNKENDEVINENEIENVLKALIFYRPDISYIKNCGMINLI